MKTLIKWLLIVGGAAVVVMVAAVVIVPRVVDVQRYRPAIEQKVAQAIGRPFHLGGDFSLSLFPWLGVSFSDLSVGNPEGFEGKKMMGIKSFEARIKVLPLLSKDIQISRFVLDGPELILVKQKNGTVNWEFPRTPEEKQEPAAARETATELPIKSLAVDQFSVTNGRILYRDEAGGKEQEVSDVTLNLKGISLDTPIQVDFHAVLDGKTLALTGNVGPLGQDPAKGTVPLDITLTLLKSLSVKIAGSILEPAGKQSVDLSISVADFSPRSLVAELGRKFPVVTRDPAALSRLALKAKVKASPASVSISDGMLNLDDSTLAFTAGASHFSKPDLRVDMALDTLDLDRYLPPAAPEPAPAPAGSNPSAPATGQVAAAPVDYAPLRSLVLDARATVKKLKAHGATISNCVLKVTGKQGVFTVDPFSMDLYQGSVAADATVNVQKAAPATSFNLKADSIQSGPLVKDLLAKEIIEGSMSADMAITLEGDTPDTVKQSLGGKGALTFRDGAVVGVDLAGMLRNTASSFGLAQKTETKPKTDFAELNAPFTITRGVVNTSGSSLVSPLLRVVVTGDADLVNSTLDLRVEPKVVATLIGQGDTETRKGLTVPVLITGTFDQPRFKPDLEGMLKNDLPNAEELKSLVGSKGARQEKLKSLEQGLKAMLTETSGGKDEASGSGQEGNSEAAGASSAKTVDGKSDSSSSKDLLQGIFKSFSGKKE